MRVRIISLILVLLSLNFASLAMASSDGGASNDDCIFYIYTADLDGGIYTLVQNDSLVIGNTIFADSNCPYTISINNDFILLNAVGRSSSYSIFGQLTFDITSNNETWSYTNVTSVGNSPSYILEMGKDNVYILESEVPSYFWSEMIANIVTIAIVFTLSTTFVASKARRDADGQIQVVV